MKNLYIEHQHCNQIFVPSKSTLYASPTNEVFDNFVKRCYPFMSDGGSDRDTIAQFSASSFETISTWSEVTNLNNRVIMR